MCDAMRTLALSACIRAALALSMMCAGTPLLTAGAADRESPPLVLETAIPLAAVKGRIDHMAIDLDKKQLWVVELGNNTVDVIDLVSQKPIHRIKGLKEPQGVAVTATAGIAAVANGDDGSVAIYRTGDFEPVGIIELGDDADNVRIDSHSGRVVVGYGRGALAVIDPATQSKIADILLAGHPEGFQLTRDGSRAFVNVPDARQIAVVDVAAGRQTTTWPVPDLRANFPLALDASDSTIAVGYRSPPRLVLLDTKDGSVRANVETCGDADDIFFDVKRSRIYVSCGQGAVDVFDQSGGELKRLARVETPSGARTALFVPELDRLFVAGPSGWLGGSAKIYVYRVQP